VNAGHCGVSVSEQHNCLEMLLNWSKVKIDIASIIWHSTVDTMYECIRI